MLERSVIGIAGYMGSGKSTLSKIWAYHFDAFLLDADSFAKEIMNSDSAIISEVNKEFGVAQEGFIDFTLLGPLVFSDSDNLQCLNRIVHPVLIKRINDFTSNSTKSVLVDAALIPLWGTQLQVDHSIWISANQSLRLERLMKRTGLSQFSCNERIVKQEKLFSIPDRDSSQWSFISNNESIDIAVQHGVEIVSRLISVSACDK